MDRVLLCGLLTMLAVGVTEANADDWAATSTASIAITGDISVSEDRISFENGEALGISRIGTPKSRIYQVTPPSNPVLQNGNRLCGETSPTFVVLAGDSGTTNSPSTALYLKIFDGPEAPLASASWGITGGGPGLCASLNYEPAASSSGSESGTLLGKAGIGQAQEVLNALGYDVGPVDGLAGPRTLSALAEFQRDASIPETGKMDEQALSILTAWAEGQETATASPPLRDEGRGQNVSGPSFACEHAEAGIEQMICGSASLSGLDLDLTQAYGARMADIEGNAAEQERTLQRVWLSERDQCGSDAVCIERAYRGRLDELRSSDGAQEAPPQQPERPVKGASLPLRSSEMLPERIVVPPQAVESGAAPSRDQSGSWAQLSTELLSEGRRAAAIAAALKGLPENITADEIPAHEPAFLALYSAVRADAVRLDVPDSHVGILTTSISPDLSRVVTRGMAADGRYEVVLWDAERGGAVATLIEDISMGAHYPQALAVFSDDSRYVALGGMKGAVLVFDSVSGDQLAELPVARPIYPAPDDNPQMNILAFSPDGEKLVATSLVPVNLKVWNVPDFEVLLNLELEDFGSIGGNEERNSTEVIADFANDETLCVAVGQMTMAEETITGNLVAGRIELAGGQFEPFYRQDDALPLLGGGIVDIACDPDMTKAAVHFAGLDQVRNVAILDLKSDASEIYRLEHVDVSGLVFNRKGTVLAMPFQDGIRFLDLENGRFVSPPDAPDSFALQAGILHAEGGGVSVDTTGSIRLGAKRFFEVIPQEVALIEAMRAEYAEGPVDFAEPSTSPDTTPTDAHDWARQSAELLAEGRRSEAIAAALEGVPNSEPVDDFPESDAAYLALYTAVRSDAVRLPVDDLMLDPHGAALSFDASRAIVEGLTGSGMRALELWDTRTGTKVATLVDDLEDYYHYHQARAVFSVDGNHLAVAAKDGDVLLVDAESGLIIATLQAARPDETPGGRPVMTSMAFNPSGSLLMTLATYPDRLKVWSVPDGNLVLELDPPDYDHLGSEIAVRTDAAARFVDDETLCLPIARTLSAGDPVTELIVGVIDLSEGSVRKIARVNDLLSGYDGGVADVACSPDLRRLAVKFQNGQGGKNFQIVDLDEPGRTILFEHVQDGTPVFDEMGNTVAVFTAEGWDFIDAQTGEMIDQPNVPLGYQKTHPTIHSVETGEQIALDIASEVQYGREKIWQNVPVGLELVDQWRSR